MDHVNWIWSNNLASFGSRKRGQYDINKKLVNITDNNGPKPKVLRGRIQTHAWEKQHTYNKTRDNTSVSSVADFHSDFSLSGEWFVCVTVLCLTYSITLSTACIDSTTYPVMSHRSRDDNSGLLQATNSWYANRARSRFGIAWKYIDIKLLRKSLKISGEPQFLIKFRQKDPTGKKELTLQ